MLALAIDEANAKNFMNRLMRENIFDKFESRQIDLVARTRVAVYGEAESGEPGGAKAVSFITWAETKDMLTGIIKFNGKPKFLKIVFAFSGDEALAVHANAKALFLNILYEAGCVTFTTAAAQRQFALDKTLDAAWDNYIQDFFTAHKIPASTRL